MKILKITLILSIFSLVTQTAFATEVKCREFAQSTIKKTLSVTDKDFDILDEYSKVIVNKEYSTETYPINILKETSERYRVLNMTVYWAEDICILARLENTRAPFKE